MSRGVFQECCGPYCQGVCLQSDQTVVVHTVKGCVSRVLWSILSRGVSRVKGQGSRVKPRHFVVSCFVHTSEACDVRLIVVLACPFYSNELTQRCDRLRLVSIHGLLLTDPRLAE